MMPGGQAGLRFVYEVNESAAIYATAMAVLGSSDPEFSIDDVVSAVRSLVLAKGQAPSERKREWLRYARPDQLAARNRRAVAAAVCRAESGTADIDTYYSPTGEPPPYMRCKHAPPHCYDLDGLPVQECP